MAAKKKTTKKTPVRKPVRKPVQAAPEETEAPKPRKKRAPKRSPAVKAEEQAPEVEEEVIDCIEVELTSTVYDLLSQEAASRQMTPAECASMLIGAALTGQVSAVQNKKRAPVTANLVGGDEEFDPVLEDPDFQDSFESMVQNRG